MFPHTWAKGGVQFFRTDVFADRTVFYEFEIRTRIKQREDPFRIAKLFIRSSCMNSYYNSYKNCMNWYKNHIVYEFVLYNLYNNKGMTICHTNEFVQSQFSDGVLFSYSTVYKKMATDRGGGVVDGRARRFQARILVPGWNPNRMQIFFSLIFVYKLTSMNSYILWRLYQFV
jgi:hypothetical protein